MPHIIFKDFPKKKYKCPIRLIRICKDNRINRLVDFSAMTIDELLSLPECGTRTAILVRGFLRENGLDFCEKPRAKKNNFYRLKNRHNAEQVSKGESFKKINERVA
jgi:hypothetical protein